MNTYIELSGYVSNMGFAIAFIVKDIRLVNKKVILPLKSIRKFFSMLVITITSFILYTMHYLLNISTKDYFNGLAKRLCIGMPVMGKLAY